MGRGFSKGLKDLESPCLHVATETLISYRLWTGHPLGLNPNYFYQKKKITFQFYHLSHPMIQTFINLHMYVLRQHWPYINNDQLLSQVPTVPLTTHGSLSTLQKLEGRICSFKVLKTIPSTYHLLEKHLSGSIHGVFLGRYQERFHLLYIYYIIYIYIYIYIYSSTLAKRVNTTSTMEYFEPLSIKSF